jgi:hypothetical protein
MGDFGRGGDSFRPGLEDFMGRASVMGSPPTAFHNQNSDPFFLQIASTFARAAGLLATVAMTTMSTAVAKNTPR